MGLAYYPHRHAVVLRAFSDVQHTDGVQLQLTALRLSMRQSDWEKYDPKEYLHCI